MNKNTYKFWFCGSEESGNRYNHRICVYPHSYLLKFKTLPDYLNELMDIPKPYDYYKTIFVSSVKEEDMPNVRYIANYANTKLYATTNTIKENGAVTVGDLSDIWNREKKMIDAYIDGDVYILIEEEFDYISRRYKTIDTTYAYGYDHLLQVLVDFLDTNEPAEGEDENIGVILNVIEQTVNQTILDFYNLYESKNDTVEKNDDSVDDESDDDSESNKKIGILPHTEEIKSKIEIDLNTLFNLWKENIISKTVENTEEESEESEDDEEENDNYQYDDIVEKKATAFDDIADVFSKCHDFSSIEECTGVLLDIQNIIDSVDEY